VKTTKLALGLMIALVIFGAFPFQALADCGLWKEGEFNGIQYCWGGQWTYQKPNGQAPTSAPVPSAPPATSYQQPSAQSNFQQNSCPHYVGSVKGDVSISTIAWEHGVSVSDIQHLNNMGPNEYSVGNRSVIYYPCYVVPIQAPDWTKNPQNGYYPPATTPKPGPSVQKTVDLGGGTKIDYYKSADSGVVVLGTVGAYALGMIPETYIVAAAAIGFTGVVLYAFTTDVQREQFFNQISVYQNAKANELAYWVQQYAATHGGTIPSPANPWPQVTAPSGYPFPDHILGRNDTEMRKAAWAAIFGGRWPPQRCYSSPLGRWAFAIADGASHWYVAILNGITGPSTAYIEGGDPDRVMKNDSDKFTVSPCPPPPSMPAY